MAKMVKDVLSAKGGLVWRIAPDQVVFDAIRTMAEKSIGSLLVMDGDRVVGIVTERDYARKVILQGRASKDTRVREIMTPRVLCVRPDQPVEDCLALMSERRIRHLPVVEQERVIGLISTGDVIKALIAEKQFLIDELTRYISGH